GAEVAGAEAFGALALDDLEEEGTGRGILEEAGRLLEEDLEEVFSGALAVDEDLEVAQDRDVLVDRADAERLQARRQHVVVRARRGHELDAAPAHAADH